MDIVVCVKRVPTSDTAVKIAADGKSFDPAGVQYELNAYDEFAIEQALQIKEKLGTGSVTVVTLGPKDAQKELRDALARWQMRCWPHPGAVALIERREGACDHLVVKNWCFLGRAESLEAARSLRHVAAGFDADGYKILCAPMFRGDVEIVALG